MFLPSGSTSLASLRASEVARSVFAAVTAKMIEFGLLMYMVHISRIWNSMSGGWSATGTFVMPGRSINVNVRTWGENIFRVIGSQHIPWKPQSITDHYLFYFNSNISYTTKISLWKEPNDHQIHIYISYICLENWGIHNDGLVNKSLPEHLTELLMQ